MIVGPASQIFSTPVENSQDEPVDEEVIRDLETATLRLQPSRPIWPDEMVDIPDLEFDSDAYEVAYATGHDSKGTDSVDEGKASTHSSGAEERADD